MFDLDTFKNECRSAIAGANPQQDIHHVLAQAIADPAAVAPAAAGLPAETPMHKEQEAEFLPLDDGRTQVTVTERGWPAGVMAERSRRGLEQTLANIARVLAEPVNP